MLDLIRRYKGLFSIVFVISCLGLVVSMFGTTGSGQPIGDGGGGGFFSGGDVVANVEGEEVKTDRLVSILNRQYQQM